MEDLKKQVQHLTPKKWDSFLSWVISDERRRRETEKAVDEALAASIKENIDKGVIEGAAVVTEEEALADPASVPEWINPEGVKEKMYFYGDVVTYKGDLVRSEYEGLNRWEPSELESGVWSKVAIEPEPEPAPEPEPEIVEVEDDSSN